MAKPKVRFIVEPTFEPNVKRGLGSVNPVHDVTRAVADRVRDRAIELARQYEASCLDAWSAATATYQANRRGGDWWVYKNAENRARAQHWAAQAYRRSIVAVMDTGTEGVQGVVAAGYPSALAVEYGGRDDTVKVTRYTGSARQAVEEYSVIHPAVGALRRAIDEVGG